jgi:hypothetical protein
MNRSRSWSDNPRKVEPAIMSASRRETFAERTEPRDIQPFIDAFVKDKTIDAPINARDHFNPGVL